MNLKYYDQFDGLTLTEMRAKKRMDIALKAFYKSSKISKRKAQMIEYMKNRTNN